MNPAKTNKVVIVRHGQSTQNVSREIVDPSMITLTPLGARQAIATGKYLRECGLFSFERIYASNMVRAVETATLIRRELGFPGPIFQVPELRERDNAYFDSETLKGLQKKIVESVKAIYPNANAANALVRSVAAPKIQEAFEKELGAEPMEALQTRAQSALEEIAKKARGDILVVAHYEVIRALVALHTGIPAFNPPASKRGHNNCTITVMEIGPDKKMNLVHLPSAWHLDNLEP